MLLYTGPGPGRHLETKDTVCSGPSLNVFVYGTVKCGINSIGPQHQGFRFSMGDGGMAIHSTVCLYAVMGHSVTCHMSRLITAPRHSGAAPADGLAWSYTGQWSWNNGKEVPRWGVAEIQKMSPSTTDQSPSRNCISRRGVVVGMRTYLHQCSHNSMVSCNSQPWPPLHY